MSESPTTPDNVVNEEIRKERTLLDKVLERRGLDRSALEDIRTWVEFPELILTPTKSEFKTKLLTGFIADLAPKEKSEVAGIKVESDVHEQPFGPETEDGANRRMANAIKKANSGDTGDPELDKKIAELHKDGKQVGWVGSIENGMVKGQTNSDGVVELDVAATEFKSEDEHFDVAFTTINFPPNEPITVVSPPAEAVRFNPEDAKASAATGFNVTAGEIMQQRLAAQGIHVDKQNWHGHTINQEIEEAKKLQAAGQPTGVLHTEEFAGFDRNEQLTGVLFDAFYTLAQRKKAAQQQPQ